MTFSNKQILRLLEQQGGETTIYPFVEFGANSLLCELVNEGYVERVPVKGDLDRVRITEKGRQRLKASGAAADEEW